jgi:hypothetical protein
MLASMSIITELIQARSNWPSFKLASPKFSYVDVATMNIHVAIRSSHVSCALDFICNAFVRDILAN